MGYKFSAAERLKRYIFTLLLAWHRLRRNKSRGLELICYKSPIGFLQCKNNENLLILAGTEWEGPNDNSKSTIEKYSFVAFNSICTDFIRCKMCLLHSAPTFSHFECYKGNVTYREKGCG